HLVPVADEAPTVELPADRLGQRFVLHLPAFAAAGNAARRARRSLRLPVAAAAVGRGERNRRAATLAPQVVGQLVAGDREEPTLQRPPRVVIRQAREKADERLLDDVLARRTATEPAVDERQEPPF